jgi:O-antigen/teichoic acid export membrane protein
MVLAQIFNLALPFLILPILHERLGAEAFGRYAVWVSTATFITILSDWGFNVYGVTETSSRRNSYTSALLFLIEVSWFKLLVSFFAILLVSITLILWFSVEDVGHLLAASSIVLGGILFPLWFYNGLDKVGFALVVVIPLRILQLFAVFIIIETSQDLNKALFFAGMPQILAGGLVFIISVREGASFKTAFLSIRVSSMISHATASSRLFLSSILTASFTSLSSVVLNLFVSKAAVGQFFLADRAIRALLSLYAAFSSGILAERAEGDFLTDIRRFAVRSTVLALSASSGILLGYFLIGEFVLSLVFGVATKSVLEVLNFYIFMIPIVFLSNVFGVQILLPSRDYRTFANNIAVGVGFYWFAIIPVIWFGGLQEYILLLLGVEALITILMLRSCVRLGLL